jgi:TPP-dependent indolepyruvate ferredoxin oxidoreductase alpha subunit
VRLLRLAMIHPLIPAEIAEFADGLDEIIVVEEKPGMRHGTAAKAQARPGARPGRADHDQ